MKLISDLQIHSRFSRATSKSINLENLEKFAKLKGIDLLGTGDITHPEWLKEIKNELKEDGSGILTSKTGFKFVLQGEISNIYSQGGKGRRVHTLLMAPSIEIAEQMQQALLKKGRIDYDGRPIFGFDCIELVEMFKSISKDIEIIPAHIWTPWFSLFGSNSGFDSIDECFGDQIKHIYAVETGLSSDPSMNWRLSQLDRFNLVSNSDAHSYWPWRLGREANVFDIKPDYDSLLNAIRHRKGFTSTIEVDPNYGKYHFDGHRNCNVCLNPTESRKANKICPKCKKPLTIGVMHRIQELADRPEGYTPKNPIPYISLMPLSEILSSILGRALATKKIWAAYYEIVNNFKSEFDVLLNAPKIELEKYTHKKIAEVIVGIRNARYSISPGYDGEYGRLQVDAIKEEKTLPSQKSLAEF